MTEPSSPDRRPPELSAVRLLNFGIRYWPSLLGLPLLGFLLVAGWTALRGEARYTAAAHLVAPGDSPPLVEDDSLHAVLPSGVRVEGTEDVRHGFRVTATASSRDGARSVVSRYLDAWERSLSLRQARARRDVEAAVRRLDRAVAEAAGHLRRNPVPDWEAAASRARLAERQADYWALYGEVAPNTTAGAVRARSELLGRIGSIEERLEPLTEAPSPPRLELAGHLRSLHRARVRVRRRLLQTRRALDSAWVERRIRSAADTAAAVAARAREAASPSPGLRLRGAQTRWELDLWRDARSLLGSGAASRARVVRPVRIASIDQPRPLLAGLLGALGGGLLGLAWALTRESLRRGRELDAPEYREFRRLTDSLRRTGDGP